MKPFPLLLASLAWVAVTLPAMANEVGIGADCGALVAYLGNCNGQTPDAARLQ
jgi:hypothetical protein